MYHPASDRNDPPAIYARAAPQDRSTPLAGDAHFDVAVIGGGFTGLSAALHLAEAGVGVGVLEARTIGWGASGRAFGQVVPYLKHHHDAVLAHYGPERGQRIVDAVASGPDLVFSLIDRHAIACDLVRSGLLFGAHAPAGQRALERRAAYWQKRGARVEMLDEPAAAAAIGGGRYYRAALLDHRGGHLNPLAYVRGLAHAAAATGARIHNRTPVQSLTRAGTRWQLQTGTGRVTADAVVIATNAYTESLWPGLARNFVALRGHGLVSRPLSENIRAGILPGQRPLTDTRRLFSGVRMLPGGHLHVSLDGPAFGAEQPPFFHKAEARVARLFPDLGPITWQENWSGWIAVTPTQYPRVHELGPGLFAGLGYSGRGIAAATMIGREIAARLRGAADANLAFPLTPLKPIFGHALAAWPVQALSNGYRWLDAWDERRR